MLFLVSYTLDPKSWRVEQAPLSRDANLAEAIVPLFTRTAQQAIRPGLLHGYRHREGTLAGVRGRVRIAEQFRTRTGLPLPIEVSYDDFTPDILENPIPACGRAGQSGRRVRLDAEGAVPLEPDLSWWDGGRCVFVGDCKYKKTGGSVPNADVYQMLAHLTALQLADGLLIYAASEDVPRNLIIPAAGKRLLVRAVDVSQPPDDLLTQIANLAELIRSMKASYVAASAIAS